MPHNDSLADTPRLQGQYSSVSSNGRSLAAFRDAIGGELHVVYAPPWSRPWTDQELPPRVAEMVGQPCTICGADHIADVLQTTSQVSWFDCGGTLNAASVVRLASAVVAIVIVNWRRRSGSTAAGLLLSIDRRSATWRRSCRRERLKVAGVRLGPRAFMYFRRRSGVRTTHAIQLVAKVLDHIRANFERPLTLCECARIAGLNPAYLSGLFSKTVGVPFKTYLTNLRLERARHLLLDPARRVSEVALAVGYRDANRFRFAFKEAIGLPPTLWRANALRARS